MNRAVKTGEGEKEIVRERDKCFPIDSSFLNGYHGKKAQPVFDAACSPTKAGDLIFSLLIQVATQWSRRGVGACFP